MQWAQYQELLQGLLGGLNSDWNLQWSGRHLAQSKHLWATSWHHCYYFTVEEAEVARNLLRALQGVKDTARMEIQNSRVSRVPLTRAILPPILDEDKLWCLHSNENTNCFSKWASLVKVFWKGKLSGIREKSTILLSKVSVGLCEGGAFPQRFSSEFIANLAHNRRCQNWEKLRAALYHFCLVSSGSVFS